MQNARIIIFLMTFFIATPSFGKTDSSINIVDAINKDSSMPMLDKEVEKEKELEPDDNMPDFNMEFTGKFKPEMFYGKNINLLNSLHDFDRVWYMRHTLDFNLLTQYGKKTYGCNVVETKFAVRDKAVWGNPRTIAATTDAIIKIGVDAGSPHRHFLTKHIFWMREGWIKFNINKAFPICCLEHNYDFTLGAFSFELGRGIALGDAYAVGPELLGFYSDSIVDQYAFGMKLTGEVVCDKLSFDLYGAVLENFSASYGDTAANIFGQQIGRVGLERGFGAINYLVAGRLNITALKNDLGKWTIEPYLLYNNDPEEDVEFLADSSSKLATMGIASEFYGDRVEFGFDTAFNFGRQFVKPWDRNHIQTRNLNGRLDQVYSHVYVGIDPSTKPSNLEQYKALVSTNPVLQVTPAVTGQPMVTSNTTLGTQAAKLINGTSKNCCQNGEPIGTVPGWQNAIGGFPPATPSTLQDTFFNASDNVGFGRFRNGYFNHYRGFMFVADGCYWLKPKELYVALGGGIATGDEDPNDTEVDGDYKGFVPLQEVYYGKRVQSAFVMGGAGKLKRPLSVPDPTQNSNEFAEVLDGFTNLAYLGGAVKWEPKGWEKKFKLFPNILFYWQPHPTRKYDLVLKKTTNMPARSFLGMEINSYVDYNIFDNTRMYFVGAIFVPGAHYQDIKGFPLPTNFPNGLAFNRQNDSGLPPQIPGLGADISWTFNIGVEYKF